MSPRTVVERVVVYEVGAGYFNDCGCSYTGPWFYDDWDEVVGLVKQAMDCCDIQVYIRPRLMTVPEFEATEKVDGNPLVTP